VPNIAEYADAEQVSIGVTPAEGQVRLVVSSTPGDGATIDSCVPTSQT
jgi:hypothetical protein